MSDGIPYIKVDASLKKMCKYLFALTNGSSVRQACKSCGIKDARYHSRVVKRLKDLSEGRVQSRCGTALKYTDDVMERALDICKGDKKKNASGLLGQLVAEGLVKNPSKPHAFWLKFRAWCKDKGLRVSISRSKPVFAISSANAKLRVEWCNSLLERIDKEKGFMERVWFGDETTQLARPHPKGNQWICQV